MKKLLQWKETEKRRKEKVRANVLMVSVLGYERRRVRLENKGKG